MVTSPCRLGNAKSWVAVDSPAGPGDIAGTAQVVGTVVDHSPAAFADIAGTAGIVNMVIDLSGRIVKDHMALAEVRTADTARVVHIPVAQLGLGHRLGCRNRHKNARRAHFAVRNWYKSCLQGLVPGSHLSAYSRRSSYRRRFPPILQYGKQDTCE